MAVLTSRHKLLMEVFTAPPERAVLKRLIRASKVDMIMSAPIGKTYLRGLAAQGPEELKGLFDVLITLLVLNKTEREIEERLLRDLRCASLQELFDSEPWQDALELHEARAKPGESRDDFFGRAFGYLFKAEPNELRIYDKYFMGGVLKNHSAIPWFFSQLQARKAKRVKILTESDFDNRNPGSPREVALSVAKSLGGTLAKAGFAGPVELYLHNEMIHDRYFEFIFSQGSIAFNLGKGIDSFDDRSFSNERMMSAATSGWEFNEKLKTDNIRPRWEDEFAALESVALPDNLKIFVPLSW